MKLNFKTTHKPLFTSVILALLSMKMLSSVLMLIVLLISAIQALEGAKKIALYTSILAIVCGVYGIIMNNFISGLGDKLDMLTHYPSLADNPATVTKLHHFFNLMQLSQFATIAIFIVINVFITRKLLTRLS